jgi:lipopolysaccharide export LptBFGC system permease protein LptF
MPFACFIAVLLGAPFGHATARQGVLRGVIACITTFLGYYALQTLMLAFGKSGKIPALMAAWSVNLMLLLIGLWLLRRMR